MTSPFAITAPATSVHLAENRLGEMPFTVTNMTDRPLRARASVVPLDSAPPTWFTLAGKAELDLPQRGTAQVLVRVEPPLGVSAATHLFRVDVADPAAPDVAIVGPSCQVVVPPPATTGKRWKVARGYLATLLGATVGGAVGELVIVIGVWARKEKDCSTASCEVGDILGEAVVLILAVLLGILLLWAGAVVGAWFGLRLRQHLGSAATALFLGILMIPWFFAMVLLLDKFVSSFIVVMILGPILFTAIPGLLARGAALLIYTRRL